MKPPNNSSERMKISDFMVPSNQSNLANWKYIVEQCMLCEENVSMFLVYAGRKFGQTLKDNFSNIMLIHYQLYCRAQKCLETTELEYILSFVVKDSLLLSWFIALAYSIIGGLITEKVKKLQFRLNILLEWLTDQPLSWFAFILHLNNNNENKKHIDDLKKSSTSYLYSCFFTNYLGCILDKDDIEIVTELKSCIPHLQENEISNSIEQFISNNLLTLSYSTTELLNVLEHLHNVCSQLGVDGLFEQISTPMKIYAKTKHDLIGCLVKRVIANKQLLQFEEPRFDIGLAYQMMYKDMDTEDKKTLKINETKTTNMLSNILQIYGTAEDFITEYWSQLGKRLLRIFSIEALEYEKMQIKLLKHHFGANVLRSCSIMMTDLEKSAALNRHIFASSNQNEIEFEVQVISPNIWNVAESKDDFTIPNNIELYMNYFSTQFSKLKHQRHLAWMNHYATVEVEVTFSNITHIIWCPAFESLVLFNISHNISTVKQLSSQLNVSYDKVMSGLRYLMKEGLIYVQSDIYSICDIFQGVNHSMYEEPSETNVVEDNDKVELTEKIWTFVNGMLTNIGPMAVEKIHSSLKLFAFHLEDTPFDIEGLNEFLRNKVVEGLLTFDENQYGLRKG